MGGSEKAREGPPARSRAVSPVGREGDVAASRGGTGYFRAVSICGAALLHARIWPSVSSRPPLR